MLLDSHLHAGKSIFLRVKLRGDLDIADPQGINIATAKALHYHLRMKQSPLACAILLLLCFSAHAQTKLPNDGLVKDGVYFNLFFGLSFTYPTGWVVHDEGINERIQERAEEFSQERLSPKGKMAYSKLVAACIFRVGGVGYSGETSKEELAFYDLLDEAQALAALKTLVKSGSYEGGLYGLLGLSIKDHGEFNRAVEIYKARKERPEWQQTGSFECFRATGETVTTQSGCIIDTQPRQKMVTAIQSGHFDRFLYAKYQSSIR
jgi:hypothetical protein